MINVMKNFIKKNLFFTVSVSVVVVLLICNPSKGIEVLERFLDMTKDIGIMLVLMFGLLGLLTVWMQSSKAKELLAKSSGIRGKIYAYLFGTMVCGPIYPGFSFGKILMEKGVKVSVVVIMLNVWATTKFALLPFEIKLLGNRFTFYRWIITLIAIFVTSIICEVVVIRIRKFVQSKHAKEIDKSKQTQNTKI